MFDVYTVNATTLIVFPLIIAALIAILPLHREGLGLVALAAQVLPIYWLLHDIIPGFPTDGSFAFETDKPWLTDLGVSFHVGMDGLSLVMVCLTVLVATCAIGYAVWEGRVPGPPVLRAAAAARVGTDPRVLRPRPDPVLHRVRGDADPVLLPDRRLGRRAPRRATLKFIIYTFVGTLLMLVGMIVIGLQAGSFDLTEVGTSNSNWVFGAFVLAFAIKSPLLPLHGWLPDAYRSAPPEVAALLSGVASKAGAYGFLRLVLPIFPGPVSEFRWQLVTLSVIGPPVRLAARVPPARRARRDRVLVDRPDGPRDARHLRAQRPGRHRRGVPDGQPRPPVGRAVPAGRLDGAHHRPDGFAHLGGMARGRPVLATTVIIVGVATLAVPGSSAFASEFLVLLGAFQAKAAVGVIASLAVILAAMYMLRWISAILHDREGDAVGATNPPELDGRRASPS